MEADEAKQLVQWLQVWGLAAFDHGRIAFRWYQWLGSHVATAAAYTRTQQSSAALMAQGMGLGAKAAERQYRQDLAEAFGG